VARIQVFAAAELLTITEEDLAGDTESEMARLLAACADRTEEELLEDVYVELRFDLCRPCQQAYLANPLGS